MENPDEIKPEAKRGSGASCFLYGCLITAVVMVLFVVVGGFLTYRFVSGQIEQYTADAPADLPSVSLSEEEVGEIEQRIETFTEAIDQGDTPADLVLTADEINALINKDDALKGRVFVTIREGQVAGEVSFPTDAIPGGKGRYFNASATFDASLTDGVLIVTLAAAEVKGEPVPQQLIDAMSRENLAKDIYKNPEVAATLRRFERLIIEDDKIILKPREASEEVSESAAGTASTLPSEAIQGEPIIDLSDIEEQSAEQVAP